VTRNHYVTFGLKDGSLRIHAAKSDAVVVAFEELHRGAINLVVAVEGGKKLVTGGEDGVVSIWRLRRTREFWRLHHEASNIGHKVGSHVVCLAVCPEQGLLVSGGSDGSVAVWDWGKRQEFLHLLKGHDKPVRFVGINAFNGNMVSVCELRAQLWHVNGSLLASSPDFKALNLDLPTSACVTNCPEHQPGIVLVLGHFSGHVSLWDVAYPGDTGGQAPQLEMRALLVMSEFPVVAVVLSRDGRSLLCANSKGSLQRWTSIDVVNKRTRVVPTQGGLASIKSFVTKTSSPPQASPKAQQSRKSQSPVVEPKE
jgi:WD40 repeat protein